MECARGDGFNKLTIVLVRAHFCGVLKKEGIFVSAVGRPSVPRGMARLRVAPMATHSFSDIETTLNAFKRVGKNMGLI